MIKLKEYVYEKNITYRELAQLLKCSERTLSRLFSGKQPSERMLHKINKLMNEK